MNLFFLNKDMAGAKTLMKKLSGAKIPGSITPLSEDEFAAMGNMISISGDTDPGNMQLIKLERGAQYVAVCKQAFVNIDDLQTLGETLDIDLRIVRVKG